MNHSFNIIIFNIMNIEFHLKFFLIFFILLNEKLE
jgi:hypothetical protein